MAGLAVTGGWLDKLLQISNKTGQVAQFGLTGPTTGAQQQFTSPDGWGHSPAGTVTSLLMKYPASTIESPHRNPIYPKSTLFPHFQLHCRCNLCCSPDPRLISWYEAIVPDVHGQVVLWLVTETTMHRNFITCLSGFNKWSRTILAFQVFMTDFYILILKASPSSVRPHGLLTFLRNSLTFGKLCLMAG